MPAIMNIENKSFYDEAKSVIFNHTEWRPDLMVILGSGFSELTKTLKRSTRISYHVIPHFPSGDIMGIEGNLHVGLLGKRPVYCLQKRPHYYEGWSDFDMRFFIQLFAYLGVKYVILTNACGGMNPSFQPGDIMLITDHINQMGRNPLVGQRADALGEQFVDMTTPYDLELQGVALSAAKKQKIDLRQGIYVGYLGPSYETKSEIQVFRQMGGDAIGMSTVPEAIVARRSGMKVLGLSCITNRATGVSPEKLSHEAVLSVSQQIASDLFPLIKEIVSRIGQQA